MKKLEILMIALMALSISANAQSSDCAMNQKSKSSNVFDTELDEPEELYFELEYDEAGNIVVNGTAKLIAEGERYQKSENTKDHN